MFTLDIFTKPQYKNTNIIKKIISVNSVKHFSVNLTVIVNPQTFSMEFFCANFAKNCMHLF